MLRQLPATSGLISIQTKVEALGELQRTLDDELEKQYPDVPPWEMQLLRAGGSRLIREWVDREFRAREIWPKHDVTAPAFFGSNGLRDAMPGGIRLSGKVPATAVHGPYKVIQLFGPRAPDKNELTEPETLFFGLHLLALHEGNRGVALEIESMEGRRTLLVLTREPGAGLRADVPSALTVVDLATSDDPAFAKKQFFERVKGLLQLAVERMCSAEIEPTPGEHCVWCDYGEVCRRSIEFSDEDSPFGKDVAGIA
jgi:hypothetical protein